MSSITARVAAPVVNAVLFNGALATVGVALTVETGTERRAEHDLGIDDVTNALSARDEAERPTFARRRAARTIFVALRCSFWHALAVVAGARPVEAAGARSSFVARNAVANLASAALAACW